jgi:hypothetical protein
MRFEIHGPFPVRRTPAKVRVSRLKRNLNRFWAEVDSAVNGLSTACGCYMASVRNVPWYIGKASGQTFRQESFHPHKLDHYDEAVKKGRGVLKLHLIVRTTPKGKFSKPSKNRGHAEVEFLEKLLIGAGLRRNHRLQNKRDTKRIREMIVPGFLNTPRGTGRALSVRDFKRVLEGSSE